MLISGYNFLTLVFFYILLCFFALYISALVRINVGKHV